MEAILEYVSPELLILVPVLYFVGMGLKKAGWFSDTLIPVSLGGIGVALSLLWVLATSPLSGWQDALLAALRPLCRVSFAPAAPSTLTSWASRQTKLNN